MEIGQWLTLISVLIAGSVALYNVHRNSILQEKRIAELESVARTNADRHITTTSRIEKLEERNDVVIEIKTDFKHLSKRLDEFMDRMENKQ